MLSVITDIFTTARRLPKVYPGYLAWLLKRALADRTFDREGIIASVGEIETKGDCRYAVRVTDFEGNSYRISVEVLP